MDTVAFTSAAGALGGTFRSEFDSLGSGNYKYTFLGEGTSATPARYLEVDAYNFRTNMGVVPATERVSVNGTEYDVTTAEGTNSSSFMTLTFTRVSDGASSSVSFALAGLDASDRVQMTATGDLDLPGTDPLYTRQQISYDPSTKKLTFSNGTPSQDFTTNTGKYVNFQVAEDNLGNQFLVDYDEAGSTSFAMKTWVPGAIYEPATSVGTFTAAGALTLPSAGLPLTAGTVEFTAGTNQYRDDGTGSIEQLVAGTWTLQAGSAIDYSTGAITGLTSAASSVVAAGDWSSVSQSAAYTRTEGITFAAGGFEYYDTTAVPPAWTAVVAGTINYTTGVIAALNPGTGVVAGVISSWSSEVQTGATSSVIIPVVKGNVETMGTINQETGNTHQTKLDVYDTLGNSHALEVSWEKLDNGIWRWRAWLPDETGISLTDNTGLIRFTADGKIDTTDTTTYNANPTIGVAFAQIGATDAEIKLDFSGQSFEKDGLEGVTQYDSSFTTKGYTQDGYAMGILEDFSIGADGTIMGVYSNDKEQAIYQLALGVFNNPGGLEKEGNTCFRESANSGVAQVMDPTTGGAGKIVGETLEMSNVDLTEEFTRLITAQRGFQANARVVTTSDQILEELINLKR
jgi:flagellar hook-basal body protein